MWPRSSSPAGTTFARWSPASTSSTSHQPPPSSLIPPLTNQLNPMENNISENPTPPDGPLSENPTPPDGPLSENPTPPATPDAPAPTPPRHPLRESFRKAIGTSTHLTTQQQI